MNGYAYRSRPSEVEAVRWAGDNLDLVEAFGVKFRYAARWDDPLMIKAGKDGAQGWVPVPVGHWIVRQPGDLTDHWPVDPDYFDAKYEAIPATAVLPPAITPEGHHTVACICDGRGIVPGPIGGRAVKCPGPPK